MHFNLNQFQMIVDLHLLSGLPTSKEIFHIEIDINPQMEELLQLLLHSYLDIEIYIYVYI